MENILQHINPVYFWDIDISKMDAQKNQRLIIERVINFGNSDELSLIMNFYGKETIMNTICCLNFLDDKTLNFFSLYFKIPKKQFKCYSKKQSIN
jgi:hypothetical protein